MASEDIPLLDQVRVAAPCLMNWDDMVGGERVRYCRACELNVYNLSEMSRADAEKLLKTHEGHLCVRYYRRTDGKIMSNNCPVGLQAIRRIFLRQVTAVASLCGVIFGGIFAFARNADTKRGHCATEELAMPTMGSPAPTPAKPEKQEAEERSPIMGTFVPQVMNDRIEALTDAIAETENALTDKKHPPSAAQRKALEVRIKEYKNMLANSQESKRRLAQLRPR